MFVAQFPAIQTDGFLFPSALQPWSHPTLPRDEYANLETCSADTRYCPVVFVLATVLLPVVPVNTMREHVFFYVTCWDLGLPGCPYSVPAERWGPQDKPAPEASWQRCNGGDGR